MYTSYVLDETSRNLLLKKFPPKYEKVIAHHVTEEFGVPADTPAPEPAKIKVVGYRDSGDGIEALVVAVNGNSTRKDGNKYHITLSLDPSKYTPKDSNEMLSEKSYTIVMPIEISTTPTVSQ